MDFFAVSAVGVVGVCNTATTICISIRTCFKANKNIGGLFDDAVALLENIEDLVRRSSVFLVAGTIDIVDFCYFAGKIEKVRDTLEELKNKLEKKRYQVHPFFSGTESVAALDYACHKLRHVAIEMRLMVGVARIGVKTSVIETQGPILDAAAAIIPGNNGVRDKQRMMENAQQAFSTHTLKSRLNKLASGDTRSAEGQLCITKDTEAFAYLARQHLYGLGMPEDPKKAFTFYMDGARQQDAECFFALGECFRFGIGITQNDVKGFEYYKKDAAMRHAGAQKLVGYCFKNGIGTEVNFLLPFAPEWQQ